jgi:peptide/nickel transport system substrate-binding protein
MPYGIRNSASRTTIVLVVVMMLVMAACTSTSTTSTTEVSTTEGGSATTTVATTGATEELTDDTLVAPIRFLGPSNSYEAPHFEANNLMFAAWEELGITVVTELVPDFGAFAAEAEPRDWDMAAAGFLGTLFRIDPDELLSRPLLSDFVGSSNYGDYSFPEYDEVVKASKVALDVDERRELVFRAQEIQALDIPTVTTYHPSEVYAYNADAYTNVVPAVATGLYNFWNFVDAEPTGQDRTYRMALEGFFRTINPMGANDYDSDVEIHGLVYDSLAKVDPTGEVVPWAAESWDFVDDTTLVVSLRPGMTFHDGEPVTAADVKFSFDYIKEWEVGLYVNPLTPVESVDVVDDLTVQINLVEPVATILSGALSQIKILPMHIWENVVDEQGLTNPAEWTESNMIGSGPYMVQSITANEAVELVRNDSHFHPPASDVFLVRYVADNQAVFRALQDGTAYFHQVASLTPAGATQAANEPHLEVGELPGTTVRWTAFSFRDDSPFRDYHFRHAIAHTYDYATTIDVIVQGYGTPGTGTIGSGNTFWFNPNIPHEELAEGEPHWHQFDLAHARQILEEAGYRWDDQGRLHYPADYVPQIHYNG